MARAIWKGSIAFGLVNIPVELYSAVRDHRPKFRLLHAKDEAPVRYERVCQAEGKPVGWEDLVKGYEYEKGHFAAKWDPEKYTDEYTDNLMKVIQGKLKGRRPRLQERESRQSADVVDLMARLRASLEGKTGRS